MERRNLTVVPVVPIVRVAFDHVLALVAFWLEDRALVALQVEHHLQLRATSQDICFHDLAINNLE